MSRKTIFIVLLALVAGGTLLSTLHPTHLFREAFLTESAYRADRLFQREDPHFDPEIHRLAQRIEWGDALTREDFSGLEERVNERHGEDTTLLFHAVAAGNTAAVDALLAAGADPYMTDKVTGSSRNFVYFLTMPGGPHLDMAGVNQMLSSYLKYGGDSNATWGDPQVSQENLSDGLALIGNTDGLKMVLKAGGDPWKPIFANGKPSGSAIDTLALSDRDFDTLNMLIDEGYFDNKPQELVHGFLSSLGSYSQRGDDISREIQRIAKRVLKRNPTYIETSTDDVATRAIFRSHWKDPAPGVIPWDEILSDAVN